MVQVVVRTIDGMPVGSPRRTVAGAGGRGGAARAGYPGPEGPAPTIADAAAAEWATGLLAAGWAALFVPAPSGRPSRLSRLALWRPAADTPGPDTAPPPGIGTVRAELALPHGRGARRRVVDAFGLPAGAALAALLALGPGDAVAAGGAAAAETRPSPSPGSPAAAGPAPLPHPSATAWAAAARLALRIIGDGRLYPAASGDEAYPVWRIGPLTAAHRAALAELAGALPPHAHCLYVPRSTPVRIADPAVLLRQFCDALADTLARTPAMPAATHGSPYAAGAALPRPDLAGWAGETESALAADLSVSLRVEPPEGRRRSFGAVLQLHTAADPALVLDAATVWADPDAAARLLGPRAETEMLLALRRGARAWPPLARLLADAAPGRLLLSDDEAKELLGDATDALAAAQIPVHWPRDLVKALTARAEIGAESAPGSAAGALLGSDTLLDFQWKIALGGGDLTQAELDRLAESRRPLVKLRDQWVVADPKLVARAKRSRMAPLTPVEALTAALTGEVERDGETIAATAAGPLAALADRIRDPGRRPPAEPPAALDATLRGYQRRGLAWLADMTGLGLGCCLADDMGLGKTITLLALHLHRQADPATAGPTLVVCPASLLGNWEREAARFAPTIPVRRYHGGARRLDGLAGDALVLVTYGVLRRDRAELSAVGWSLVAADEAQHVKNPYSTTARELRALPATARVALTGTPVENNLSELWALLDWTTPGLLGPLSAFRDTYARAIERGSRPADADEAEAGAERADRLSRLVRPFLLRRRKADPGIAPELPAKTETDRVVPLTTEQTILYEAVVRDTMDRIREADGIARRGLVLKLLTALKQICNHPAQYLKEHSLRRPPGALAGRSGKLALLDELLATIGAEDESALVFTQYTQMAKLLERHLTDRGVPSLYLHGGTPVPRREEMVADFQSGRAPVFLLSLKAAGTGLNLTRATHVIHYDRWWNPAVEDQATDRAYRIGQDRPVQVHRLITEGTVEDKVARLLDSKRALADSVIGSVIGSGEAALSELSDDDLAELVALGRQS